MEPDERPSKTQRKKAMHELQSLGERLVELNSDQLASLELPEALRDALDEAARVKSREGRRRQMQYIGRLMRDIDPAPIRQALAACEGRSRLNAAREREIVHWREHLLENESALGEFASLHASADIELLASLVRSAREERLAGRAPKNYRALYRALKACIEGDDASAPLPETP